MHSSPEQRAGKAEALPELTEVPVVGSFQGVEGGGSVCPGGGGRGEGGMHPLSSALARLRNRQS